MDRECRREMAWASNATSALVSLAAPLLSDFLGFCSLAASQPLFLAYLLFFFRYLLAALSFLAPLLFSTCFLLLALLTASPYLGGFPPNDSDEVIPGPCGNTLRLVLAMLNPSECGETGLHLPSEALYDIATEIQTCVASVEEMYTESREGALIVEGGSPGSGDEQQKEETEEEKRIVAETVPGSNEIFSWELDAISKLYKALMYEVEELPIKLALRSIKEGEFFSPETELIHGGDPKSRVREPRDGEIISQKETPHSAEFQVRVGKVPICEDVDIPLGSVPKSAIKSRDYSSIPVHSLTDEDSSLPKKTTPSIRGITRLESDCSRPEPDKLRRSSSSSSMFRAPSAGFSRVASARGWTSGGTKGTNTQALSNSASTRKEKEWRRTLACKLFEERMIADGGEEGMDMLWETYELGSDKVGGENSSNSSSSSINERSHEDKNKNKKDWSNKAKRSGELHVEGVVEEEGDDEEVEEEEEEETVGRLCCLQALRISTSKVGLGMGRSGLLLKMSKAMKGVGVFRRRAPRTSRKTG